MNRLYLMSLSYLRYRVYQDYLEHLKNRLYLMIHLFLKNR